jgi:cold-inducible RNA-binding protein
MGNTLYVANLSTEVTEEDLRTLFGEHGEVASVEFGIDEQSNERFALIQMTTEKTTTRAMNILNGHQVAQRYLAITYAEVDLSKELMPKQRKLLEEIAATLDETEEAPLRRLSAMALLCGISFMQSLLKEALEIDAGEGLMTSDNSRRRTKGGVFFYIARYRMTPAARHIIYTRRGKFPPAETSP